VLMIAYYLSVTLLPVRGFCCSAMALTASQQCLHYAQACFLDFVFKPVSWRLGYAACGGAHPWYYQLVALATPMRHVCTMC
jgi:hypothetical protein